MRLLFVNPPGPRYLYRGSICTYISKARYVWKPKDFILLSSVLPPDWPVEFLDAAINDVGRQAALARIAAARPDAVVLALSSIVWKDDLEFLKAVRESLPSARILAFGEAFLEPSFRRDALKFADGIIDDPLRSPFLELLSGGAAPDTPNDKKQPAQPRAVHAGRHELFDNRRYRWPFVKRPRFASVYTQFGCPFSCTYCTESRTSVTYRPAENVLAELRLLKAAGYRELHVGDASFGFPQENARALLEGMIVERLGFSWSCYTYPGLAGPDMLRLMAQAGCHTVVIGVDSADGALLEKYGRHLPQGKIKDFVAACKANGIEVCGDLIIGFKEDTRESCLRTIELAVELGLDYASFNIATPLLGSSIREDYKAQGVIHEQAHGFDTAGLSKIHGTSSLGASELLWLRNHAVRRFYLRPSYWWKRLTRLRGPQDALLKLDEALGVVLNLAKQERTLRDGYL